MFNRKTVFILGAGASWHYGYPTGEELVRKVIAVAGQLGDFFGECGNRQVYPYPKLLGMEGIPPPSEADMRKPWFAVQRECQDIAERLRIVNPLVIDYFLGQSPSVRDIGKFPICWVILACEEQYLQQHANLNRKEILERSPIQRDRQDVVGVDITAYKDGWYRFVLQKLASGCTTTDDLHRNNVSFVTFNYDVSLEYALYYGLNANDTFESTEVSEFLANQRVIHCYGKVREVVDPPKLPITFKSFFNPPPTPSPTDTLVQRRHDNDRLDFLNEVFESSKRLSTIDPEDKTSNADLMQIAQQKIRAANVVYILGYGFDEKNSERLQLTDGLRIVQPIATATNKVVLFTNFNDSNRVNKKASRVLTGDMLSFLPPRPPIYRHGTGYFEKSIRDVYQALELDFDELEDE